MWVGRFPSYIPSFFKFHFHVSPLSWYHMVLSAVISYDWGRKIQSSFASFLRTHALLEVCISLKRLEVQLWATMLSQRTETGVDSRISGAAWHLLLPCTLIFLEISTNRFPGHVEFDDIMGEDRQAQLTHVSSYPCYRGGAQSMFLSLSPTSSFQLQAVPGLSFHSPIVSTINLLWRFSDQWVLAQQDG